MAPNLRFPERAVVQSARALKHAKAEQFQLALTSCALPRTGATGVRPKRARACASVTILSDEDRIRNRREVGSERFLNQRVTERLREAAELLEQQQAIRFA